MNMVVFGGAPFDTTGSVATPTSTLSLLLAAVLETIVNSGAYSWAAAFVSIDPDPWPTVSGPFVAVMPGPNRLIRSQWAGAGAFLAGYRGEIIVRVADQHFLDEVGRDGQALLTPGAGLMDAALAVTEILTGDSASRAWLDSGLVQRDLIPRRISHPTYRRGGRSKSDSRWRAIDLAFEVDWTHVYNLGMV